MFSQGSHKKKESQKVHIRNLSKAIFREAKSQGYVLSATMHIECITFF